MAMMMDMSNELLEQIFFKINDVEDMLSLGFTCFRLIGLLATTRSSGTC